MLLMSLPQPLTENTSRSAANEPAFAPRSRGNSSWAQVHPRNSKPMSGVAPAATLADSAGATSAYTAKSSAAAPLPPPASARASTNLSSIAKATTTTPATASSTDSGRYFTFVTALPTVAKVVAVVAVVKAAVTFYHHYQHLKAERDVAELQRIFAAQPMLIMANVSEDKDGHVSSMVVEEAGVSSNDCGGDLSSPPKQCNRVSSSSLLQHSPPPSPPAQSALNRSTLSSIRVLSVRTPQPGQWRSLREDDHTNAFTNLERVLGRVHLFVQPRWALAPNLSPDATLLEAYMRLHRIPYTVHTVNVLHGGGDGNSGLSSATFGAAEGSGRDGGSWRSRSRNRSRAASWDPERDPTGIYSGLSEKEMQAERVRRVHAHIFATSRRSSIMGVGTSTLGSGVDSGATIVGRLMVLARAVQQTNGRKLPFIVYRGELIEGETDAIISYLNEKFLIPSDEFLLRDNEEAASLAQALRRTVHYTLRSEYGVGFIKDGPGVFCQYASQAMGPIASPWAMRVWLLLPWIGSPLRDEVQRASRAGTLGRLSHRQRQAQVLKDVLSLENLLRMSSSDPDCPYAKPFLLTDRATALDCGLFAYLVPIMRLRPADVAQINNNAFTYIYDSLVLRDYVTRMTALLFPDLDLMTADVTGVPLAIPYDRDMIPARVARRREQECRRRQEAWMMQGPRASAGDAAVDLTPGSSLMARSSEESKGNGERVLESAAELAQASNSLYSSYLNGVAMEAAVAEPNAAAAVAAETQGPPAALGNKICSDVAGTAPSSGFTPATTAAPAAAACSSSVLADGPASMRTASPELQPRARRIGMHSLAAHDSPLERTPPPLPTLPHPWVPAGFDSDADAGLEDGPPAEAPPPSHPLQRSRRAAPVVETNVPVAVTAAAEATSVVVAEVAVVAAPAVFEAAPTTANSAPKEELESVKEGSPAPSRPRPVTVEGPIHKSKARTSTSSTPKVSTSITRSYGRPFSAGTGASATAKKSLSSGASAATTTRGASSTAPRTTVHSTVAGSKLGRAPSNRSPVGVAAHSSPKQTTRS